MLTGVTSSVSSGNGGINLTWTHAGSSAGDLISGASSFAYWQLSCRMKGASTSTDDETPSTTGTTSMRSLRSEAGYPNGAVVQVRLRAKGDDDSSDLYGPWSNTLDVTFKNDDDDYGPLTFSGSSVTVGVSATATYTVAMDDDYGYGAGVVSLSSSDPSKVTVSPAKLTFTASTYSTAQTVTVTGVATGGNPKIDHSFRLTGATADAIPDAVTVGMTVNKSIILSADSTSGPTLEMPPSASGKSSGGDRRLRRRPA